MPKLNRKCCLKRARGSALRTITAVQSQRFSIAAFGEARLPTVLMPSAKITRSPSTWGASETLKILAGVSPQTKEISSVT